MPILPYIFGLSGLSAVIISVVLVGIALMITGGIVGLLSGASPFKRGLRQLAIGWGAAAVTYCLGLIFDVSVSWRPDTLRMPVQLRLYRHFPCLIQLPCGCRVRRRSVVMDSMNAMASSAVSTSAIFCSMTRSLASACSNGHAGRSLVQ